MDKFYAGCDVRIEAAKKARNASVDMGGVYSWMDQMKQDMGASLLAQGLQQSVEARKTLRIRIKEGKEMRSAVEYYVKQEMNQLIESAQARIDELVVKEEETL
jgi:hypothetical protein